MLKHEKKAKKKEFLHKYCAFSESTQVRNYSHNTSAARVVLFNLFSARLSLPTKWFVASVHNKLVFLQ